MRSKLRILVLILLLCADTGTWARAKCAEKSATGKQKIPRFAAFAGIRGVHRPIAVPVALTHRMPSESGLRKDIQTWFAGYSTPLAPEPPPTCYPGQQVAGLPAALYADTEVPWLRSLNSCLTISSWPRLKGSFKTHFPQHASWDCLEQPGTPSISVTCVGATLALFKFPRLIRALCAHSHNCSPIRLHLSLSYVPQFAQVDPKLGQDKDIFIYFSWIFFSPGMMLRTEQVLNTQ